MIPLYKLEKLPRTQQLRKIAKIFIMAETRLAGKQVSKLSYTELFSVTEQTFFTEAAKLLAGDKLFPQEARQVFEEAQIVFEPSASRSLPIPCLAEVRRALNNIKHLLLNATGKDQSDWDFTIDDGRLDAAERQIIKGMHVYLEDIRSPFNVGAMFRTAESFGVEKIILSPFCADPRHKRAERTAMGCIDIVPWERKDLFASADERLPDTCPVFALETGGVPIDEFPFPEKGLLIAGSEELGVSPRALEAADSSLGRVSIPIYGAKASLNVSVAFGIALNAWRRKVKK